MKKGRNRHHCKPKSRGGNTRKENMLFIKKYRHEIIHKAFGNLTLYEIIILLLRTSRAKHYEEIEPKIKELYTVL